MPRSRTATAGKILIADDPVTLEEQLRRLAVNAGPQQSIPNDPLKTQVNIAPPKRPGEEHEDPTPEPDGDPLDPDEDEPDPENPEVDPATIPPEHPADRGGHQAALQKYQSRIHVVEAWKYPGSLRDHPDFVNPEWVAWAEYDDATKQESGPALRVPTGRLAQDKLARKGDYVVRQLVTMDPLLTPEETLDVWPARDFEKLFIPTPTPQ